MVTSRQIGRGVYRTLRAIERDAARAQRQRLAYEKALAKQAILEAAADAAQSYSDLLDRLRGAHRIPFFRVDWTVDALAEPPADPVRTSAREEQAAAALARYQPGWFARTFGLAEGQRRNLRSAVARARSLDDQEFEEAVNAAKARRETIDFAKAVIARERPALTQALNSHLSLETVIIEGLNVLYSDDRVIAMVDGAEQDDLPTQSVTLLQSGKASVKPLPTSKILELHRDNICSSAIRVAAEFLKALPLEAVEVVVDCDLLDCASGHITAQPVFYARITAQALSAVNLLHAEPAPLAERLGAHFDWSKREGFRPINLGAFDVPTDLPVEEHA